MQFRNRLFAVWFLPAAALAVCLMLFAAHVSNILIGLMVIFAVIALVHAIQVTQDTTRLDHMFAGALPPRTIEQIAHNPALLKLDGESREVTYLSCGVRGLESLAAPFRNDPSAFTRLMNCVLAPLMEQVQSRNGTIDRLTADGFVAFWNAPLEDSEHAAHACEAAMAMSEALANINKANAQERRNDGSAFPHVEIGIGIATGPAIAGAIVTPGRTIYGVNGDCTALARRIQSLSSQYGPTVIVSEETRKAAEKGFAFLEVDFVADSAHPTPVVLYAMLGNPVMRASPKFRALMAYHEHIFRSLRSRQWDKARGLIEQCRKLSGASQKLYDLHLARIAQLEKNPPGDQWDGAFRIS
jgi:adenylate cyclase